MDEISVSPFTFNNYNENGDYNEGMDGLTIFRLFTQLFRLRNLYAHFF